MLIAGLAWRGRARRTDQLRAGLVMWGLWLITFGVIYSDMSNIPHTAYVASLAPPLAALSGTGIVLFWRWYRSGSRAWWLLPLAVAVEVAWAYYLWSGYRGFLPWLAPTAIVAGGIAIVVMAATRLLGGPAAPDFPAGPGDCGRGRRVGRGGGHAGRAGGVVGVRALRQVRGQLVRRQRRSSRGVRPGRGRGAGRGGLLGTEAGGFRPGRFRDEGRYGDFPGGGSVPGGGEIPGGGPGGGTVEVVGPGGAGGGLFDTATTLTGSQLQLYQYLEAHRDGARYLFAVQGWTAAGPYILATGQAVLPMGGFSGSVPEPTLARVKQLVAAGQLRFFMLDGGGGFGGGLGRGGSGSERRRSTRGCSPPARRSRSRTRPCTSAASG